MSHAQHAEVAGLDVAGLDLVVVVVV